MVKVFDLIENIKRINPENELFITTYKFNIDFFESFIFPRFINHIFPLILIDYNEYQNNIVRFGESKFAEKKYFIESINLGESYKKFHPKLLLSFGKKNLQLWIGSNNLTTEGYTDNAELLVPIDIDFETKENIELLEDLCDFLTSMVPLLGSHYHQERLDKILKQLLERIPKKLDKSKKESWILHNLKDSLLQQIISIINNPIKQIYVVAPFFSQNENYYRSLLKYCNSIHIIVQQHSSNLPKKILKKIQDLNYSILTIPNKRYLHAKLMIFQTNNGETFIFTGSANFTSNALLTTNNVELGLLIKSKYGINQIIEKIGSLQSVELESIKTDSSEPFDVSSHNYEYQILSSTIDGDNTLKLVLDKDLIDGKITLYLGDIQKEYNYEKMGKMIIFKFPESERILFQKNRFVRIEINSNGTTLKSDSRLINDPILFPLKFNLFNSLNINDPNWLIDILLKLIKLPENFEYPGGIIILDEKGLFTHPNKEKIALSSRGELIKSKRYPSYYTLKGVIEYLIVSKSQKIMNAIDTKKEKKQKTKIQKKPKKIPIPYEILDIFILVNKLIIAAITSKTKTTKEILFKIRVNLKHLLLDGRNYFKLLSKNEQVRLIKQTHLKYHVAIILYITHELQKAEIKKDPEGKYENVKERFELDLTRGIQKLVNIEDNIFDTNSLKEHIQEYSIIFNEILKYTPSKFIDLLNSFMTSAYNNPSLRRDFEDYSGLIKLRVV